MRVKLVYMSLVRSLWVWFLHRAGWYVAKAPKNNDHGARIFSASGRSSRTSLPSISSSTFNPFRFSMSLLSFSPRIKGKSMRAGSMLASRTTLSHGHTYIPNLSSQMSSTVSYLVLIASTVSLLHKLHSFISESIFIRTYINFLLRASFHGKRAEKNAISTLTLFCGFDGCVVESTETCSFLDGLSVHR